MTDPAAMINLLMDQARAVAGQSPNRVRQVGAAIHAQGRTLLACNTFPQGVADRPERHEGDGRFVWMEHAERNAIFQAARAGVALEGAMIATSFFPCIDCARAIVQSGFSSVITPPPAYEDPVWGQAFYRSKVILEEGGVSIIAFADQAQA
jgi:dCMP deaminase